MRSGKAIRLDDEAYADLMRIKGLIEARDSREYSASDLLAVLVEATYGSQPSLLAARKILENGQAAGNLAEALAEGADRDAP